MPLRSMSPVTVDLTSVSVTPRARTAATIRPRQASTVSIAVLYWHFVTIVWIAVFLTFYIAPRIG